MSISTFRWRWFTVVTFFAAAAWLIMAGCPGGGLPASNPGAEEATPTGTSTGTSDVQDEGGSDDLTDQQENEDDTGDGGQLDDQAGEADETDGSTDDETAGGDGEAGTSEDGSDDGATQSDETAIPIAFTFDPSTLDGAYLMAFHACDGEGADCSDPANHQVYLASSDDGQTWTVPDGWEPYEGSVPDVIERGEMLYIYTPNRVVQVNMTTGEVSEPVPVELDDPTLPAGFVDPSPILDDEGRIVLFFIAGNLEGAIGTCPGGETSCTVYVYSATETDERDGIHFTLDDGARMGIELDTTSAIKTATDPDIYYDGSRFVLYVSHGPSIAVGTSTSLRGSYTLSTSLPDGLLTYGTGGVGSGEFDDASGMYWTYAHVPEGGVTVIRRAVHADLTTQLTDEDFTIVIDGSDLGFSSSQVNVASPGIWKRH